jgi:O-antigen/teichoic acid export membrane protein
MTIAEDRALLGLSPGVGDRELVGDPSPPDPASPITALPASSDQVLARNVSWLTVGQIVTWTLTLVWTVIVPRRLGSAQVGIFTLSTAVAGVLMVIVGLGMGPLLVREIATQPDRAPRLIGTAIVLRAGFLLPALAATLMLVWLGPFHGEEALAVLLGGAACVGPGVVLGPISSGFQAIEKMRYLAFISVVSKLVTTVGGIALVLVGVKAVGLLAAAVIVGLLTTGLGVVWARPHFRIDWRVTRRELGALFIRSLPYWSFAAFFTIYLWIDSLMLGIMTSSTVLGWYGLPTQLFGTLMFVPVILSTAWLSRLVRAHRGGTATLLRTARPAIELVMVLSMPVCVGSVLVAGPLVHALYGPGFAESAPIFALLALCVPPMYLNSMASQVMVARNQQVVWTKMMVLASLINPLLNLLLIPYFQRTTGNGAIGASVAMVITEVVLAGIGVFLIRDAFTRQIGLRLARGAVATAGMAGVVLMARHGGLVPGILSGIISFAILALLLRVLSDDERAYLVDAMREAAGKRWRRARGRSTAERPIPGG